MTRPIVVTGVHRAGTSMVARAARSLGVWLGEADDLVPPAPDNPDGFFEHRGLVAASDLLFGELGGGWDCPPVLTGDDLGAAGLEAARDVARPILAELAAHEPWGWKDPRVAPVLPFWRDLVPGLGVVVCVRNPLEVAASLRTRNGTSLALGLRLWYVHLAPVVTAPDRLVTHYDAWFQRPHEEAARLAAFIGVEPDADVLAEAARVPARHLRHSRFDAPALRTANVHADVRALYELLLAESAWDDGAADRSPASLPSANGSRPHPAPPTPDRALGRVRPWVVDVGLARHEVHRRNGRVAQLERQLQEVAATSPGGPDLEDLQAGLYDLQLSVAELAAAVSAPDDATRATDVAYARMVRDLRREVRRHLPTDADVVVLGDGEPALLDLHGRASRHFPPGPHPLAPGPHPPSGRAAAAALEVQRALGATHLVVSSTSAWWLGAYGELADALSRTSTVLWSGAGGASIHQLHGPVPAGSAATIDGALAGVRRLIGRDPVVLDVTPEGLGLPSSFRPVDADLPYLDATIDVVVHDGSRADVARLAAHGILAPAGDGWAWTPTGPPPDVPVDIVLVAADLDRPAAYLDALRDSLPAGRRGELVVVAPADTTGRWRRAAADRATVVDGPVGTVLADVAGRDGPSHVALVDGSAIPLDGWVHAVLAPFARGSSVGLVAGRRRLGDGTIHAAHAVEGDGVQPTLGGETDRVTRPIDVAVPGIVAWRRDVLAERGLDDRYRTLELALADHCWALAERGHDVLVQPEAETADLGVVATPAATMAADRARLDEAWAAVP